MPRRHIPKLEIDKGHRLYFFSRKVVLREKKEKIWVTTVVSKFVSDILDSPAITNDLREKIKQKLEQFS
jgi:hypothetical protein